MDDLAVKIFTEEEKESWNAFVDISKWGDILQFWQWGETKLVEGWQPVRIGVLAVAPVGISTASSSGQEQPVVPNHQAGNNVQHAGRPLVLAQALIKKVPLLGNYLYVPHGPVFLERAELAKGLPKLVEALKEYARAHDCFAIEIEPKIGFSPLAEQVSNSLAHFVDPLVKEIFLQNNFTLTKRNTQPKYKLYYDLGLTEEQLQGLMKKNTRYNVHLAEKKGVEVREYAADDPQIGQKTQNFYELLLQTRQRTRGYPIRPLQSFQRLFAEFAGTGKVSLFETLYNGDLIASNISEKTAFWSSSFYAASNRLHTEVKAIYLLRWRAIQAAKTYGCKVYDFWGIIPGSEEHKGYSDTKLSFGGTRIDTYGIMALPISPLKFFIWDRLLPVRAKIAQFIRRFT